MGTISMTWQHSWLQAELFLALVAAVFVDSDYSLEAAAEVFDSTLGEKTAPLAPLTPLPAPQPVRKAAEELQPVAVPLKAVADGNQPGPCPLALLEAQQSLAAQFAAYASDSDVSI